MFSALISSSLSSLSMVAIAAEDNLELENVSDAEFDPVAAATEIKMKVTKAYQFVASTVIPIDKFPINDTVFNKKPNYFCIQHGVSYGGKNIDNLIGDKPDYHDTYIVTKNKLDGGSSSSMTADIDSTALFYVDSSATLHTSEIPDDYVSHRESDEKPTSIAYTNWVYQSKDISFD